MKSARRLPVSSSFLITKRRRDVKISPRTFTKLFFWRSVRLRANKYNILRLKLIEPKRSNYLWLERHIQNKKSIRETSILSKFFFLVSVLEMKNDFEGIQLLHKQKEIFGEFIKMRIRSIAELTIVIYSSFLLKF